MLYFKRSGLIINIYINCNLLIDPYSIVDRDRDYHTGNPAFPFECTYNPKGMNSVVDSGK